MQPNLTLLKIVISNCACGFLILRTLFAEFFSSTQTNSKDHLPKQNKFIFEHFWIHSACAMRILFYFFTVYNFFTLCECDPFNDDLAVPHVRGEYKYGEYSGYSFAKIYLFQEQTKSVNPTK